MKRFLIYIVVVIGTLFVGLSTYYFVKNNENISLTIVDGSTICMNPSEEIKVPVLHTKARTAFPEIKSSNEEIASYNKETKMIEAHSTLAGGTASFTVTPSNKNFPPMRFTVWVGNGSAQNPYFIETASQLVSIGTSSDWSMNKSYRLENDIDMQLLGNIESGAKYEFKPLGGAVPFSGVFDGNLKSIMNLNISADADNAGLFCAVAEKAIVENVFIKNATINGKFKNAGAIAGISSGEIRKCFVENSNVKSTLDDSTVGGIIGKVDRQSSRTFVEMCSVKNTTVTAKGYVGGIVGTSNAGIVFNSFSNATISSEKTCGGLVGYAGVKVIPQSGNDFVRGTIIKNSYAETVLTDASKNAFGIVGESVADKVSDGNFINKFVGNYFTAFSTTVVGTGKGPVSGKLVTKSDLSKKDTFVSEVIAEKTVLWNFEDIWAIEENAVQATIKMDGGSQDVGIYELGTEINAENFNNVINAMRSGDEAKAFTYNINSKVIIDLGAEEWIPIGDEKSPFKGSIVVDKKKFPSAELIIKNLKINAKTTNAGFFGVIGNGAKINGITFKDVIINPEKQTSNEVYVGVVAGQNMGGTISNVSVDGIKILSGTVVGGIVGLNNGVVSGCSVVGSDDENFISEINVSSNPLCVGGIVGKNTKEISNVSLAFTITVNSNRSVSVGGVAGINGQDANANDIKVKNGYVEGGLITTGAKNGFVGGVVGRGTGKVESSYSIKSEIMSTMQAEMIVGGVVGYVEGESSLLKSSFSNGTIKGYKIGAIAGIVSGTVEECYSKSILTGKEVGGLVYDNKGTIENCYNLSTLTGIDSSSRAAGFCIVMMKAEARINKCFSGATFSGEGEKNEETFTNTRSWFADITNEGKPGKIVYSTFNIKGFKPDWITQVLNKLGIYGKKEYKYCPITIEDKLSESNISEFINVLQFNDTIWNLSVGKLPEIKSCDFNGVLQTEPVEPVDPKPVDPKPVDPVDPKPVDPVNPKPVDPVVPKPVG